MKIEVDAEDFEKLIRSNKILQKENFEISKKLSIFEEENIKKIITEKAQEIFIHLTNRIFSDLGYDGNLSSFDFNFYYFYKTLGEEWFFSDELDITFAKEISNKYKKAFINLELKKNGTIKK